MHAANKRQTPSYNTQLSPMMYSYILQTTSGCILYCSSATTLYYSSSPSPSPPVTMESVRGDSLQMVRSDYAWSNWDPYRGLSPYSVRDELSYYIKNGDLENIKTMFALHSKDKIETNWKMDHFDYRSPIHEATASGQNDVLQWLLSPDIGFDVNERTANGFHILHLAAFQGITSTIQLIVEKYNVSPNIKVAAAFNQLTPLMIATQEGHLPIVQLLHQQYNATTDMVDGNGSTALHRASHRNNTEIVRYLVESMGADMEMVRKQDGFNSLIVATYYGHFDTVRLLLDLSANVNTVSFGGFTAAQIALNQHHFPLLRLLISRGSDIDYVDDTRQSLREQTRCGSSKLRDCVEKGLIEYRAYYQKIKKKVSEHTVFCGDIVRIIMDLTYPTPMLLDKQCTKTKLCMKRSHPERMDMIDLSADGPPIKKQKTDK